MKCRTECYGLMERCVREFPNISCGIRVSRSGSFACTLHAHGGIGGNEVIDSESKIFSQYDTADEMNSKFIGLQEFLWLNEP